MGNSFGSIFRVSTWGESHGGGIGVVVDGCPPQLPLTVEDLQPALDRRRPGQSKLTTPRDESDQVETRKIEPKEFPMTQFKFIVIKMQN